MEEKKQTGRIRPKAGDPGNLHDHRNGPELHQLPGHPGHAKNAAFHPLGKPVDLPTGSLQRIHRPPTRTLDTDKLTVFHTDPWMASGCKAPYA